MSDDSNAGNRGQSAPKHRRKILSVVTRRAHVPDLTGFDEAKPATHVPDTPADQDQNTSQVERQDDVPGLTGMGFVEQYSHAVNAASLVSNEFSAITLPLMASALADTSGTGLGALLCRAKYGNAIPHERFESGAVDLVKLLNLWRAQVKEKAIARRWVTIRAEWDLNALASLVNTVAEKSLAYWLDGHCKTCGGTTVQMVDHHSVACPACKGTGMSRLDHQGEFARTKIVEMFDELNDICAAHRNRAAKLLRKIA